MNAGPATDRAALRNPLVARTIRAQGLPARAVPGVARITGSHTDPGEPCSPWAEDGRHPMPWDRPGSWDHRTLDTHRSLARLRRSTTALRRGGLRWLHAGPDSLMFLRELGDERILVHAARAAHRPVRLPFAASAEALYGGGNTLRPDSTGNLGLPADGPAFPVWVLR